MDSEDTDVLDELDRFIDAHWDPAMTVGEWWALLGLNGWSAPMLPEGSYGRGATRVDALRIAQRLAERGALGAPGGLGLALAAPTIATHGSPEQVERFVRDIVTGQRGWCQLFSEPGAGSDLASLSTRAVRDGDVWVINGQKVWTSGGQYADYGMLLARTNPDAPKHQGISWFAFDMHQPGVEVRPLKEMTGNAMFNEVFFSDAVVHDDARIGGLHDGWKVANTTLAFERAGMGSGTLQGRGPMAIPGTVAAILDRPAGEFAPAAGPTTRAESPRGGSASLMIRLAQRRGCHEDASVRQGLVTSYILAEVARLNTERQRALRAVGQDIPGLANLGKLHMANVVRHQRDLGLTILGARGMVHGYTADERDQLAAALGDQLQLVTAQALSAQALPIYGGTDQIQRNIIAERVLGLPKDPPLN